MSINILGVEFYDPIEAAEILGMSKESVWGYLRQGRLIGRKSGRKWLISEPKLKAFAAGDDVELAREQIRE